MASLLSPLEAAWAMLLKIDPHEEEDWELAAYERGQDEGIDSLMGSRAEEEDPDADLITNPQSIPKPDVQLEGEMAKPSNDFNLQQMAQHAVEAAEADAMGGAKVAKPPIDSRYQRFLDADAKLQGGHEDDTSSA